MNFKRCVLSAFPLCLIVAGCSDGRDYERRLEADRTQRLQIQTDQCKRDFPAEIKQAVARATCINTALATMKPYLPYPDLLDQEFAMYVLIAEKVQTGKMTLIERDAAVAQLKSQTIAEQERRSLARRSVSAQESVAAAANSPSSFSCVSAGKTVICN